MTSRSAVPIVWLLLLFLFPCFQARVCKIAYMAYMQRDIRERAPIQRPTSPRKQAVPGQTRKKRPQRRASYPGFFCHRPTPLTQSGCS